LVYYRVQNISPLVSTFGEVYSIHSPISYFATVFEFKDETNKANMWSSVNVVLKRGHFGK